MVVNRDDSECCIILQIGLKAKNSNLSLYIKIYFCTVR